MHQRLSAAQSNINWRCGDERRWHYISRKRINFFFFYWLSYRALLPCWHPSPSPFKIWQWSRWSNCEINFISILFTSSCSSSSLVLCRNGSPVIWMRCRTELNHPGVRQVMSGTRRWSGAVCCVNHATTTATTTTTKARRAEHTNKRVRERERSTICNKPKKAGRREAGELMVLLLLLLCVLTSSSFS